MNTCHQVEKDKKKIRGKKEEENISSKVIVVKPVFGEPDFIAQVPRAKFVSIISSGRTNIWVGGLGAIMDELAGNV